MAVLILLGRILFVLIFFTSVPGNFNNQKIKRGKMIAFAPLLVPLSVRNGIVGPPACCLEFMVAMGWSLIIFLIPVSLFNISFGP
jgi:hypothetical protein